MARARWRTRRTLGVALVGAALIAAACGGDGDDDAASTPPAGQSAAQTAPATDDGQASGQAGDADAAGVSDAGGGDAADEASAGQASRFTVTRVDRGTKPDITIDEDGTPLVAYMLERLGSAGWVKVARADGSDIQQVHSGYVYGPLDIETGPGGRVVVGYHDHDAEDGAVAIRENGAWSTSRIDHGGHDGWDSSIAFGGQGDLLYLGIDPSQFGSPDGVELARFSGGEWEVRAIGSGPQPYEWGTDVAVMPDGSIAAVFFDAAEQDLVFGLDDGTGFALTPIASEGDAGRFAVLEIDGRGRAHVAFFQTDGPVAAEGRNPGDIVYGVRAADGTWTFETIGAVEDHVLGFTGARRTVALALDEDRPIVAFIDETRLQLATQDADGAWAVETVTEAGPDPLQVVGLDVDADGAPHLTYSTITSKDPLDGEVWYAAPGS